MRFMISKTNFHSLSWFLGFYKSKRKGIIANKLKQQSTIYPCTYCGKKKKTHFITHEKSSVMTHRKSPERFLP